MTNRRLTPMLTALPTMRTRLTNSEALLAARADRDVLSALVTRSLDHPEELPAPIPRGDKDAALTVVPRLALPADRVEEWKEMGRERRGQHVRAGLHALADHIAQGRYDVKPVRFPGTEATTPRMTTGTGPTVQRAAWRTRRGEVRMGTRPGQVMTASETDLRGTPEPQPLWEVWEGDELMRVIAAPNLYFAAQAVIEGRELRAYRPEVLLKREEMKGKNLGRAMKDKKGEKGEKFNKPLESPADYRL